MQSDTLKKLLAALDIEPLLTIEDVGGLILNGVSPKTIRRLLANKHEKFPQPIRIGGQIRWTPAQIRRYLESKTSSD